MKIILLALILSLACIYIVQADDGLNSYQTELLKSRCSYITPDIRQLCRIELT